MIELGAKEQKLLEYMQKYAHSEWRVICDISGDFMTDAYNLVLEVESDYDCDDFQNWKGEILGTQEFRKFVFPERVLELYDEYMNTKYPD